MFVRVDGIECSRLSKIRKWSEGERERERDTRRRWRISPLSRSLFIFLSLLLAPSLARSLARSKRPFQFSAGTGVACQRAARRRFLSANAMKCVSLLFFSLLFLFFPPLSGKHLRTWLVCRAARKPARKISGQRRNASSPD